MSIIDAVRQARNSKRNFNQSFDLSIALKGLDMKKPESKIKGEVVLPFPRNSKICIIADSLIPQIQKLNDPEVIMIRKDEIANYGKKEVKKLASECSAFLAEAPLMTTVVKHMGQVLGPRGKLPKPIPPTIQDIRPIVNRAKCTVRYAVKDSPVINCFAGKEDMKDEDIAKNIEAILNSVSSALPKGRSNISKVFVKLTMGKPVKIEL